MKRLIDELLNSRVDDSNNIDIDLDEPPKNMFPSYSKNSSKLIDDKKEELKQSLKS